MLLTFWILETVYQETERNIRKDKTERNHDVAQNQ